MSRVTQRGKPSRINWREWMHGVRLAQQMCDQAAQRDSYMLDCEGRRQTNIALQFSDRARAQGPHVYAGFCAVLSDMAASFGAGGAWVPIAQRYAKQRRKRIAARLRALRVRQ